MNKLYITFLLLFFVMVNFYGQKTKQSYFKINGTINIDTGRVSLCFYTDFTSNKEKELVVKIRNNKFSISGYISEPQGTSILIKNTSKLSDDFIYMSSDFIIEKGVQNISINIDSTRKIPNVGNEIMRYEYPKYEAYFEKIHKQLNRFYQKEDSLRNLYNYQLPEKTKFNLSCEYKNLCDLDNRTLLQYCKNNPNSNVAFWRLIRLMSWGYEAIFDSIYDSFSTKLKNGYAGKILNEKLKIGRQLTIGKQFPSLKILNRNQEEFRTGIFLKYKFTLVDFWYSHCGPCRAQFDMLRKLYSQFNSKGFEIVGISVDQNENENDWKNVITNEKLIWQQYWDINGNETHKLSINAFPSNFLVDDSGKIIAKNISLEELEKLLKQKID